MEISIKWNICRICLQEESAKEKDKSSGEGCQMRHIHNDIKLSKQIYECSGVLIDPEDSLPDKICTKCLTVLRYAVNFRNTCRNSDEYLQSVLKKAKSATSLFKLEKKREETLHLVDDVIEEIEEHELESYARDELQEDYHSEKRKRTPTNYSKEQLQVKKKSKVVQNEPVEEMVQEVDEQEEENEEFLLLKKPACAKLADIAESELEHTEISATDSAVLKNTADEATNKLLQDLVGEEKTQEVESSENTAQQNVIEDEDVENVVNNPLNTKTLEIKKESAAQAESVCSSAEEEEEEIGMLEETLSDEQDDEEDLNETDFATTQEESNTTLTPNIIESCASKDKLHDEITAQNSNTQNECILPMDGDREFFYLLSVSEANEIKTECVEGEENLDTNEHAEYIVMDEEAKSECDNANVEEEEEEEVEEDLEEGEEESIEYLIDSADEHSLTALEYKGGQSDHVIAAKVIKRESVKRKGTGEVRVYVCDVCGNHFTNRNLLNFHMKIHRNEKNFECELCYKRFNAACNLSAHMRIHTGEKPFECQFCARRFTDRSTHIKHERIHTNEKPYSCGICGKSFSLSTSLKAHEKIHTGEKPYKCEPCAKSFKLPHQLKAHLNTHLHKLLLAEY